jgi:hypothetical protein
MMHLEFYRVRVRTTVLHGRARFANRPYMELSKTRRRPRTAPLDESSCEVDLG